MSGPDLSDETDRRVNLLFPPAERDEARRILREECGNNLPFCHDYDSIQMERIRFGALKLSNGKLEDLIKAVQMARRDWRDLLVASGFAHRVDAHKFWVP